MYHKDEYSFDEICDVFGCIEVVEDVFGVTFRTSLGKYEEYLTEDEYLAWDGQVDPENFISKLGKVYSGEHYFYVSLDTSCKQCRGHKHFRHCCVRSAKIIKKKY